MTALPDRFQLSVGIDEAREDYVTTKLIEYNQPYASPLWKNRPRDPGRCMSTRLTSRAMSSVG